MECSSIWLTWTWTFTFASQLTCSIWRLVSIKLTLYLCYFVILVWKTSLAWRGCTLKFSEPVMSVSNILYEWCVSTPGSSLKQGGLCLWWTTWLNSFFFSPQQYTERRGRASCPDLNTDAALFSWRTNLSFSVCCKEQNIKHGSTESNRMLYICRVFFLSLVFLENKFQRLNCTLCCHHMVIISYYSQ